VLDGFRMSVLAAPVDFVVVATFSVSMRLNRPFVLLRTGGVRSLGDHGQQFAGRVVRAAALKDSH
jgi:hypothetical protein